MVFQFLVEYFGHLLTPVFVIIAVAEVVYGLNQGAAVAGFLRQAGMQHHHVYEQHVTSSGIRFDHRIINRLYG